MTDVAPLQFSNLRKFFPELTELQATQVCMLVFGNISIEDLAEHRGVCSSTVKESMAAVQKKLCVSSTKMLRAVVMSRVLMKIAISGG